MKSDDPTGIDQMNQAEHTLGTESGELNQRQRIRLGSFLPSIIRALAEMMSDKLSRSYDGFQLTVTEWRILLHLAQHKSLHASQIVESTKMEKSKVSRALASMEVGGIVLREQDADDNRRQRLELTEYGVSLYQKLVPKALDWEKELIEGLEVGEYRDLLFLLDKLKKRLKEMD